MNCAPRLIAMDGSIPDGLFDGLCPEAKRRLYFLLLALNNATPAVISLAEEIERYVAGVQTGAENVSKVDAARSAPPQQELATSLARAVACDQQKKTPHCSKPDSSRKALLDARDRETFAAAATLGSSNQELATKFNMTARQAQALRMGIDRGRAQRVTMTAGMITPQCTEHANGARNRVQGVLSHADDVACREAQETFLRQKPAPPQTLEDVVRFVRQIGDIVVRTADGYLINSRLRLTPKELVDYANRKRQGRGKLPFRIEERGFAVERLRSDGP